MPKVIKHIEYKVVYSESSFENLSAQVNEHMENGWELHGGVSVGSKHCAQAMVRAIREYEDE